MLANIVFSEESELTITRSLRVSEEHSRSGHEEHGVWHIGCVLVSHV